MNKTFLKVLKYLGVALLGAFTGIGALFAISSCEAKRMQSANAQSNEIVGGVYRSNSYVDITNYSRVVPSGFTYNSCIIKITGSKNYFWSSDFGNQKIDEIDIYCFLFTNDGNRILTYDEGRIRFTRGGETETQDLWDQQYGDYDNYYGSEDYTRFYISSSSNVDVTFSSTNEYLRNLVITYFYEDFNVFFSQVKTPTFTFYESWNYNAPYFTTTNYLFIEDNFSSSTPSQVIRKEYDFIYGFVTNGEYYNKISLTYFNGIGTRYYSNGVHVNDKERYGYFDTMIYLNTNTGASKLVCQRSFSQRQDGSNGLQTCLETGSVWSNSNYQRLLFLGPLTSDENTSLAQFNNNLYVSGINSSGVDVGLGNVFTLFRHAFSSFIPILNIQIIPGITIGLLIFLPLISGIIVAIIWVVKR